MNPKRPIPLNNNGTNGPMRLMTATIQIPVWGTHDDDEWTDWLYHQLLKIEGSYIDLIKIRKLNDEEADDFVCSM